MRRRCVRALRIAVPLASVGLLVLINQTLRGPSRGPSGATTSWFGPAQLCASWSKLLETTQQFSAGAGSLVSDGDADLYFVDALTANDSANGLTDLTFRLRKLSEGGARVFDTELYAQLPAFVSARRRGVRGGSAGAVGLWPDEVNAQPRLVVATHFHDASQSVLVLQSGLFNVSALPTAGAPITDPTPRWFSALSLYSSNDGTCYWGAAFTGTVADGGPQLSSGCGSVDPVDDSGFTIVSLALSQGYTVEGSRLSDGSSTAVSARCVSWVAALGRVGDSARLSVFHLQFACAIASGAASDGALPSLRLQWSLLVEDLPAPYRWDSESALPLISLQIWGGSDSLSGQSAGGSGASSGGSAGPAWLDQSSLDDVLVLSLPLRHPNAALAGLPASSLAVYNLTSHACIWSLSSSPDLAPLALAVISNIALSPAGILYAAIVRNVSYVYTTPGGKPLRQRDSVAGDAGVVAIEARTGGVLWQAPFSVSLTVGTTGLVFCAIAPSFNVSSTADANGSTTWSVTAPPSSWLGLGVINLDDGSLAWHDSETALYPPNPTFFTPTRIASCASNVLVDDRNLYTVIDRRVSFGCDEQLGTIDGARATSTTQCVGGGVLQPDDAPEVFQHEYSVHVRAVRDGGVLWGIPLGRVPVATAYTTYAVDSTSYGGPVPAPYLGQAASRLQPFSVAVSGDRRLVVMVDGSTFIPVLPSPVPPAAAAPSGGQPLFPPPASLTTNDIFLPIPMALGAFACPVAVPGRYTWVYIFVALVSTLLGIRVGLGTCVACVGVRVRRGAGEIGSGGSKAGGDGMGAPVTPGGSPLVGSELAPLSLAPAMPAGTDPYRHRHSSSSGSDIALHLLAGGAIDRLGFTPPTTAAAVAAAASWTGPPTPQAAGGTPAMLLPVRRDGYGAIAPTGGGAAGAAATGNDDDDDDEGLREGTMPSMDAAAASSGDGANGGDEDDDGGAALDVDAFCTIPLAPRLAAACRYRNAAIAPPTALARECCRGSCDAGRAAKFLGRPRHATPWVLVSLIHYVAMVVILQTSVRSAHVSISALGASLSNPITFYSTYLINRTPSPVDTACASPIVAACYCSMPAHAASVSATQPQCTDTAVSCPSPILACAGSCDDALRDAGNCAASVFAFTCACPVAADGYTCSDTTLALNATTLRLDGYGGLPAGLASCQQHYDALEVIMGVSSGGYIAFAVLAMGYQTTLWWIVGAALRRLIVYLVRRCCPACIRYVPLTWLRSTSGGSGGGSGAGGSVAAHMMVTPMAGGGQGPSPYKAGSGLRRATTAVAGVSSPSPVIVPRGGGAPTLTAHLRATSDVPGGTQAAAFAALGAAAGAVGAGLRATAPSPSTSAATRPPALTLAGVPGRVMLDGSVTPPLRPAHATLASLDGVGGGIGGGAAAYAPPSPSSTPGSGMLPPPQSVGLPAPASPSSLAMLAFAAAPPLPRLTTPIMSVTPQFPLAPAASRMGAGAGAGAADAGSHLSLSLPLRPMPLPHHRQAERLAIMRGPHPELRGKGRIVSVLIFLALCQVGLMVAAFVWSWFVVLQGRYCTGADSDGSGEALPVVGNIVAPTASLILRTIPGCVFGSAWQDADLEGAVLRDVWLSLAAQGLSILVLIVDQGFAMLHACVAHCRLLQRRAEAGLKVRAVQRAAGCGERLRQLCDSTLLYSPEMWLAFCGDWLNLDCRRSSGAGRAARAGACCRACCCDAAAEAAVVPGAVESGRGSGCGCGGRPVTVEVDAGPPCCRCRCDVDLCGCGR